ncbi:MAG: CoA-binding protein [Chloroflexota bacterium]
MAWDPAFEVVFNPKVVAMVGVTAGAKRGGIGETRAGFLEFFEQLEFPGRIYPVNPRATEILGYKVYPSVSSIPEPVDLVIISTPAQAVPSVLEDCIKANARNVHVFTAGFEETGDEEAIALGRRVRDIALRGGLRVIGPNCMGLYVPESGVACFGELTKQSGPVSFLSQSGGHCNWFSHYGQDYGIYFSKVISFGNAYILDSTDYLEYLATDPKTQIIGMYLEGVKDGRKLLKQVREINRVKPVILWKGGLTASGSRAVASHTGSLAGQGAIWHGFFAQTGAVPVFSLDELAETIMTFVHVKPPKGKRVAVLGSGGGSSVAAADTCNREGLDVPALTLETQAELRKFISLAGASIKNPLDTGVLFRDVSLLEREIELVAADPNIDMLIVMPHMDRVHASNPDQVDHFIDYLCNFAKNNPYGKPVVIVFFSLSNEPWEGELRIRLQKELPRRGVAVYNSLTGASRALARFYEYHRFQKELTVGS